MDLCCAHLPTIDMASVGRRKASTGEHDPYNNGTYKCDCIIMPLFSTICKKPSVTYHPMFKFD